MNVLPWVSTLQSPTHAFYHQGKELMENDSMVNVSYAIDGGVLAFCR